MHTAASKSTNISAARPWRVGWIGAASSDSACSQVMPTIETCWQPDNSCSEKARQRPFALLTASPHAERLSPLRGTMRMFRQIAGEQLLQVTLARGLGRAMDQVVLHSPAFPLSFEWQTSGETYLQGTLWVVPVEHIG